jgi:hypothetical protein
MAMRRLRLWWPGPQRSAQAVWYFISKSEVAVTPGQLANNNVEMIQPSVLMDLS